MPNINTNAAYQQILSMALEDRSSSYEDLVSNNNALLAVMRKKGLWQTYSGPRIRQTLQIGKQTAQWYSGYDQLLNPAIDIFNDAYFDPKMVVVPIILSMQEILNNEGEAQLMDVYDSYIDAAERALEDTMDVGLYSDGTANGGKQLTGLATAVPIVTNSGTYGGIDRGSATIWRTTTFDAQTYNTAIGTQVSATTIRPFLNAIMTNRSRGRQYADLLIMSPEHYAAYDAATIAIQRQTNETSLGQLGFTALEYIGGGKRAEIVLDGGILRGTDVVKALALGANAVAIGKLQGWGLGAGGKDGLLRVLEILENEIQVAMGLLGVTRVDQLKPSYVCPGAPVAFAHEMSAFPHLPGGRLL